MIRLASRLLLTGLVLLMTACSATESNEPTPVPASTFSPEPTAPALSATPTLPTPTPTTATSGVVTINAVGDIMLARDIIDLMAANGAVYPYIAVRAILADADLTIANMEGTFTERGTQADKFYTFRTPPQYARGLAEAGIDVVSLGNNHTVDYGAVGLTDTLAALDAAGVKHAGAGVNAAAARTPLRIEVNGLRIAFLSYNAVTESTPATATSAGVAWGDEASVRADVTAAKQGADAVIVTMHAGTEYVDAPAGVQRGLAYAAIDAGADLVLGSHPHVLQGWERYNGGFIAYSLGNFVFDLDTDDLATLGPRPFQTIILRLKLTKDGVGDVEAVPVFIDPLENRPVPATGERRQAIIDRLALLNAGTGYR